jgi:hypothetical protein
MILVRFSGNPPNCTSHFKQVYVMRIGTWTTLLFLLSGFWPRANADFILTNDGQKFEGAVTDKGDSYEIKTKYGQFNVKKSDVKRIVKDPNQLTADAEQIRKLARSMYDDALKLENDPKERNRKLNASIEVLEKVLKDFNEARDVFSGPDYDYLDKTIALIVQEVRLYRDKLTSENPSATPPVPSAQPTELPHAQPPPVTSSSGTAKDVNQEVAQLPIPDAEAVKHAETNIRTVFKADLAKIKPEDRMLLAEKFLTLAKTEKDVASRFVLMREAIDMISKLGELDALLDALEQMEGAFVLSGSGNRKKALAGVAAATKDAERSKVITAMKTLSDKPDDPAANLMVGKYFLFSRGDWDKSLPMLAKGTDPAWKAVAEKEMTKPTEGTDLVSLGDGLISLAEKERAPSYKQILQERAICWYQQAIATLTGLERTKIEIKLRTFVGQSYNASLNDINSWKVASGDLSRDPDGGLREKGDSNITYQKTLPENFTLNFLMNVTDGMRPRIYFTELDLYFGNEGYDKLLYVHGGGASSVEGSPFPYANNKLLTVRIIFAGGRFEFYINEKLVAKGNRKSCATHFRLRGGDFWSPGTTVFSQFRLSTTP